MLINAVCIVSVTVYQPGSDQIRACLLFIFTSSLQIKVLFVVITFILITKLKKGSYLHLTAHAYQICKVLTSTKSRDNCSVYSQLGDLSEDDKIQIQTPVQMDHQDTADPPSTLLDVCKRGVGLLNPKCVTSGRINELVLNCLFETLLHSP